VANSGTFTIEDYKGKKSSMSGNVGPITALNFTAKRDALDDLKAAIPPLIRGEIRATNINERFAESAAEVTDDAASVGSKWRVVVQDQTQFFDVGNTISNTNYLNTFEVELPTADETLLAAHDATLNLLDGGVVQAFVEAFEAAFESPWGGNEIKVLEIRHVNRTSS
jgi:hypothetical protein